MNIKLSGWIKNHESQNAKGWGGTLKVPCSNQSAVFVSGGKLICFLISFLGPQETTVAPPRDWEEIKGCDFPLLFYGVKGKQMREGESPSYFNPVEIAVVVDLIDGLLKTSDVTKEDIGVMAPYRRQVYKLRLVLRSRGLRDIRVGTVDDYQGQEEKIIFISTVLTRPKPPKKKQESDELEQTIGFLGNAKRFNVAITRAKVS
jgi:hypothetical protein